MKNHPIRTRALMALAGLVLAAAPRASAALTSTTEIIGGNVVTRFTAGSGTWTVPAGVTAIKLLTVAGGGGGGTNGASGGGGAGGLVYYGTETPAVANSYAVTPGASVAVTVGTGGAAHIGGQNSIFGTVTAVGGGYGGQRWSEAGGVGGSGGGASVIPWGPIASGANGTSGQGHAGGGSSCTNGQNKATGGGGGGGGAGTVGSVGTPTLFRVRCGVEIKG